MNLLVSHDITLQKPAQTAETNGTTNGDTEASKQDEQEEEETVSDPGTNPE